VTCTGLNMIASSDESSLRSVNLSSFPWVSGLRTGCVIGSPEINIRGGVVNGGAGGYYLTIVSGVGCGFGMGRATALS
jgi:hypothetical protein